MRISDWSSDVCSSDLPDERPKPTVCGSASCLRLIAAEEGGRDQFLISKFPANIAKRWAWHGWRDVIGIAAAQAALRSFGAATEARSEEHTSELQSLMRISYAVFCLKKKNNKL